MQVFFLKHEAQTREISHVYQTKLLLTGGQFLGTVISNTWYDVISRLKSYLKKCKWRFSECCKLGRISKTVFTKHNTNYTTYSCTIVLIMSNGWVTKHENIPLENPQNSLITGVTLVSSISDNWYLKIWASSFKHLFWLQFPNKHTNTLHLLTYKSLNKDPKMVHHEEWLEQVPSIVLKTIA